MNAIVKTGADGGECSSGTLGDLLYSNKTKVHASEKEWLEILQSIVAGDRLALRALYERTHRIVFTLAMRVVDNRESAEEVTLEVFQDVWRMAAVYDRTVGSVIGWISGLARSKATDRLRFEQKSRSGALPGAILRQQMPFGATPASHRNKALEPTVRPSFLPHALTALAIEERQVIESALFSESTYVEVAAQLSQPPGTVRTRIRYGLAKLRMAFAEEDKAS